MAVEDFANCYVNRVGGDVDTVITAVEKIGVDAIRNIVAAALAAGATVTVTALAGAALEAYIVATFGISAWEGIVLLLGAASWAAIIDGFIHCAGQL